MKKLLFTLLTWLMATQALHADVTINSTNFPDANFRNYLLSVFTSGVITDADINNARSLSIENLNIASLDGIEYFTNLQYLYVGGNKLTSLDLTSNRKLIIVFCEYNELTSLDVSGLTLLEKLRPHNNTNLSSITGLYDLVSLQLLNVAYCGFSQINVSLLNKLEYFDISYNTSLTRLNCHSWNYFDNKLISINVEGCTNLQDLDFNGSPDLTTIEGLSTLTSLTSIDIGGTAITSLDATPLTNLQVLECENSQLTELDITGLSALTTLRCENTSITELDLKTCPALQEVDCSNTKLTQIHTNNNCRDLISVNCSNNSELTYINICYASTNRTTIQCQNCTKLQQLFCDNDRLESLDITGCTALTNLKVYSNAPLTSITGLSTCTALQYFSCSDCPLGTLDLTPFANLKQLNCDGCGLSTLDFSHCPYLETLICGKNNFYSLDLSSYLPDLMKLDVHNSPSLYSLNCNYCDIYSINVTNCPALDNLDCSLNRITELDLTGCTDLRYLDCGGNQLTSLDVSEHYNLEIVYAYQNQSLTELLAYNCKLNKLVVNGTDLRRLECYYNPSLSTITGLSDCGMLQFLDCSDCAFTTLDITPFDYLKTLHCYNNQITALDLSNSSQLEVLNCKNNRLSALDAEGAPSLKTLNCSDNSLLHEVLCAACALTSLNVSYNISLQTLLCGNNPNLASITGLGDCYSLSLLSCGGCNLSSLDLSDAQSLTYLFCHNNQLTSLDVSACDNLQMINCYQNRITGTGMTTLVNSLPQRTQSSPGTFHAIYNTDEQNTMTTAQIATATAKYWIPKAYNGSSWVNVTGVTRGDVNNDGNVNISDVTALINGLLSNTPDGSNYSTANADCNQDGNVNISDVTALINRLLSGSW